MNYKESSSELSIKLASLIFKVFQRTLKNQMSIYFFDIVQSHNTIFFVQKFDVIRVHDII